MAENLAGKTLKKHYYLESKLDNNGFGAIYLARNILSAVNDLYIVKHFSPNYKNKAQQETVISLFQQECESLQKLGNHPQIPRIYDFFLENGNLFLVQEFVEGETLQQEFARMGKFDSFKAVKLLAQILEVLKFIHQSGHIHRDIKPTNLIRNRFDDRIFLINFGAIKEKINPKNFDEKGSFLPTSGILNPGYTPDEQLHGRLEFCSDLYALGMVIIEAMTGEHPSNLPRNFNLKLIWRDRLSPDLFYNPVFLNIIDRIVAQKWQERYQSADIVLQDLKSIHLTLNTNKFEPNEETAAENGELVTIRPVAKKLLPPQIIPKALPQTKIKSKSSSNKLEKLFKLGIFSAIAILLLLYLNSLQQKKYITYENEYIKIEYPKTWQRENLSYFPNTTLAFVSPKENAWDRFQEKVEVVIEEYPKPISLKQYSKQAILQLESLDNFILSPPQSTKLGRSDANYVLYKSTDRDIEIKGKEVWTVNYQQIYRIIYIAEPDKFQKFLPQATRMIESLEILR